MHHRAGRAAWTALLAALLLAPVPSALATSGADPQLAAIAVPAAVPSAATHAPRWAPGRVLVRYTSAATPGQRRSARAAVAASRTRAIPGVAGLEVVETSLPVAQAIGRLKKAAGVRYAEPDYEIHADVVPNDPKLDQQWAVNQSNGIDIDAPAAWDVTTGDPSIPVAVIDTGVQLDHPDLAANLWTNPGEIPGNGIDDDNDGYVDDVHGWDFVDDDAVPDDEFGHGTHVAGTIGAVGNNGIGVAGIAYGTRIMPLRVLDAQGTGFVSDGVRAIAYAAAHGIRVANISWTFGGAISQPLWDAITSAGDAGLLITAAAGNSENDADTVPEYPAAYDLPSILSVAALAPDGTLAWFSNRGIASVDLAAPGESILSTWIGSTYRILDGTSMAAPHVAGVAALVLAAHPGWTVAQVRDRLLETTHPRATLSGLVATGGVLNAGAALAATGDRGPQVRITAPAPGATVQAGVAITLRATASDPEDGNVGASVIWHSNLMGSIGTGATHTIANLVTGTHLITATARDSAGHRRSATIQLRVGPPVLPIDEHADPSTPAITIAPDGTPVIAWAEPGTGTIVSRKLAGGWTRETATASYADVQPDLLAEPDGTVRVAVEREWKNIGALSDGGIVVAADDGSGAGAGWSDARVSEGCGDDADGCGIDTTPALARDGSGHLHLAWSRVPVPGVPVPGNSPGLWHAVSNAAGGWTAEPVLSATDVLAPAVATAPDGSVHIVFWRSGGAADGLYHATNETGDWVVELIAAMPADGSIGAPSVQPSAAGRVDVAWGTSAGAVVRSRIGGTWQGPVTAATGHVNDVDLVRDGTSLHLAFGESLDDGTAAGIGYALGTGAGWTVTELDTGQDVHPRLAVDTDGHPHVAYLRAWPEHEVRHATDAGAGWTTEVVDEGWTWTQPAVGVDSAGHHYVAAGRYGSEPGVWYATDRTGSWVLERLTQHAPDGQVGLVVAPDGTVAIGYAELFDAGSVLLADHAVWLKTGTAGHWTTRRIATNPGTQRVSVARSATGRLYVAYTADGGASTRIGWATNATGTWASGAATTAVAGAYDDNATLAVDGTGRMHIAYEHRVPSAGAISIRYATNASGAWTNRLVSSGTDPRFGPAIALAGTLPRIAYWIYNASGDPGLPGGVRLAAWTGSAWSTRTVSSSPYDSSPSIAVDAQGHAHVVYARSVGYAICATPFCAEAPGLRYWSDSSGFGGPRRVTDYADDSTPSLVRGADGSIRGAFTAPGWRLAAIDLSEPPPSVTAPVTHLAAAGTVASGKGLLNVTFTGRHAALFNLAERVGSGSWRTVGSRSGTTSRNVSTGLSPTTPVQFRVSAFDGLGRAGSTATGHAVRVWGRQETPGSGLTYAGPWSTLHSTSYWGGAARFASSRTASVTFTVTAKELDWISRRGPGLGDARITVDGVPIAGTVKLSAASTSYRQVVLRRIFARVGTHRITIRPAGNGRIYLDGFLALR